MKIDGTTIQQLTLQITQGNQRAFEDLYRLFFPRLFNFAMLYTHKKEVAEEIVNDVMIKIWQKKEQLPHIQNLETYLFTAVRNQCLNYLSKYSHYQVVADPDHQLAALISLNDSQQDLEWKEIYAKLNLAIEALPEQCKTVFKLIKEEGFKYKEVAEILNISPRTVETQLFRAIKKLMAVTAIYVQKKGRSATDNRDVIGLLALLCCFC
jgi:RNA polymerase sigma-70 factor (family 1)